MADSTSSRTMIGLGTWMDKVAYRVVERERRLGRSMHMLRTQAGIGASGIVHIGSMSDSVRAYAISLAIRNLGYSSEMIQFADDMDGLRSVPADIPPETSKHLLQPVSLIPDPFKCHESYAAHVEGILLDGLARLGVEARLYRGYEAYSMGLFREQISRILSRWRDVGRKIEELTGQSKFLNVMPYFPLCSSCGRIYTAVAREYEASTGRAPYKCVGVSIKGVWREGCGYEGEADISKAEGKLSWKVEWAARWAALDIRFEAFGKDLADSVKVNDWVSREILGYDPPLHIQYELFLDETRKKISKSKGVSVFTPEVWFRYGAPQSLVLLLLKRIKGTRIISHRMIPTLMDELDRLAENYYGGGGENGKKGLYSYVYFLKPPANKPSSAPYSMLVELAMTAPAGGEVEFILSRLSKYGYEVDEELKARALMALRYYKDFGKPPPKRPKLDEATLSALQELVEKLPSIDTADDLQGEVFNVARLHGLQPSSLFQTLYIALIGQPRGPRLGPFVVEDIGKDKALAILKEFLSAAVSNT
ncbi:MAG: lysine--tRNA ligase [Nitrososphaerota archaeon]